ncbi:hypothetical protein RH915_00250 [Serpentinicella sp. ANB-PHB4]|uniref:hypothetical protein n=1 Tax=Serpentinicella sp. ANB-PHB4 TaxID=3074076 RepID=UPI00285B5530|nr:hypothetical protein [Serpentinicella sp. ANB-PHB4]MDR5657911.1 hypothetical protein [Serpentinicella sp. ANB-PHB4]
MKIIFTSKANSYKTMKEAYKHIGLDEKLIDPNCDLGKMKLHYLGLDSESNEVYVSNYYKNKHIFSNIISGLGSVFKEEIIILDID